MKISGVFLLLALMVAGSAAYGESPEEIAVLGTGMMGSALGPRFAAAGHKVTYGTRDAGRERIVDLVAATGNGARALSHAEAVAGADIVVIAVPYKVVDAVVSALGDALDGKIVVDITNAIENADDGLPMLAVETSGGEILQARLPRARIVKAFNTVGFHVVAEPGRAPGGVSVPVASDHDDARARVLALVEDIGFAPFDAGPLRFSRTLERLAALYRVPHWSGRRATTFEYYFRPVAEPTPAEFPVLIMPRD
jgi:predicted dinucleotide-binding enzyme